MAVRVLSGLAPGRFLGSADAPRDACKNITIF
jgi:hypothetical protein